MTPKEEARLREQAKADLRKYIRVATDSAQRQIKRLDAMSKAPKP